MFDYPATLTIRISDEVSSEPISHIAVIVTLFAAKKNDYNIPRVTDARGEIGLTIEEVRQSIDSDQKLFLMDYVSPLEECSNRVEIEVCDGEQIKRTIEAMEMYKDVTEIDESLINSFKSAVNARYAVPVVRRFEVGSNVSSVEIRIPSKTNADDIAPTPK